jgi:hypothetical protein
MARIIGAVACSHTPTIGFAFDKKKHEDPAWAPIFEAFELRQADSRGQHQVGLGATGRP